MHFQLRTPKVRPGIWGRRRPHASVEGAQGVEIERLERHLHGEDLALDCHGVLAPFSRGVRSDARRDVGRVRLEHVRMQALLHAHVHVHVFGQWLQVLF